MQNFKDKLRIKEEAKIEEFFNDLDSYKIDFPNSHKDINEDVLRDGLEKCNLAQDAVLQVERIFREDISSIRIYLRTLKTHYKISYNEILSEDDRKISVELKKAAAEAQLKDSIYELNEVESWLSLLENSLEYILSKKSDIKQKNYDFKSLYKIYSLDKESMPIKSFYASWDKENNSGKSVEDLLECLD